MLGGLLALGFLLLILIVATIAGVSYQVTVEMDEYL